MRSVKYVIGLILISMSFIFTGELFIYYLDNFQESYYQATFSMTESTEDNSEIIADFLEASKIHGVDFFFVDGEIVSDVKKEITIYGTDTALEELQSNQIENKLYTSLFVGQTEVKFELFKDIKDIKEMKDCYFIGDDTARLMAFKAELVDKYYGGNPKLYSSNQQMLANLVFVWGGSFLLILLISCYEVLVRKKEHSIRYILGEDMRYMFLKNILFETIFFMGSYFILSFFLSRISNVTFMSSRVFLIVVIFILMNVCIQLGSVQFNIKKNLSKDFCSQTLLKVSYVIKALTLTMTLILISFNLVILMESYDYYHQREFFKNHEEYDYYQINYKLEVDPTTQKTSKILQQFYQTFEADSLIYGDLSDEDYFISLINENTKEELIKSHASISNVLTDCRNKKLYILVPKQINVDSQFKNYFQTIARMYLGESFSDDSMIEYITYHEKIQLVGINDDISPYRSRIVDAPIILLNQTGIHFDPTGNSVYYAYDVMYDLTDEAFEQFIEEHELENQIVKQTNVWELYQYNWEIAKRCMKLVSLLSVFMILLESAMIVFILRLEYNFKAMEIVLKKTLGYTLFERERVLFILTITLSVISIILSIIIGALCSVKSISYLVGLGMMLTLIEISYMIYKMKQLERVKIVSVLKGEYV
ncbi:MAG: hypothetical protein II005_10275 [Turicibacter sp.]|nr:hypothetical protein [Turicibacter sp.]MEE1237263.1 hypothetical protein [Turicibacter sp.]